MISCRNLKDSRPQKQLLFLLPLLSTGKQSLAMKSLSLSTVLILLCLPCIAQDTNISKKPFIFPEKFALTLSNVEGSSVTTELKASWSAIPSALVYEVELAELYVETVFTEAKTLTLSGNSINGLGSNQNNGGFGSGFHVQVSGTANGNDGTYIVAKKDLGENSLKLVNTTLNEETVDSAKVTILRIDPVQWDYGVKKEILFGQDSTETLFSDLEVGVPHIARIRSTTEESKDFSSVDTGFSKATLPFFTAQGKLKPPTLLFDKISTHSFTAIWLPPENAETENIDYQLEMSSSPDFKDDYKKIQLRRKTSHEFADIEPETTRHIRVTAIPGKGYARHAASEPKTGLVTTLPIVQLELTSTVSSINPTLRTLTAKWNPPTNAGNEFVEYSLEVAKDEEFKDVLYDFEKLTNTQFEIKELIPRTIYHFRVVAHPPEGNTTHKSSEPITGSGITLGNKLESPANLTATAGIGSISAKWEAPINSNGDTVYYVQVQFLSGGTNSTNVPDAIVTTKTEHGPITELEKDANFLVTVLAGPAENNAIDEISDVATVKITTLTDEDINESDPASEEEEPLEEEEEKDNPEDEGNENNEIAPPLQSPEK